MTPSRKELEGMAQHVLYEFTMFDHAAKALHNANYQQPSGALILEGFLWHGRILRDFFLAAARFKDDVMAADYYQAGNWPAVIGAVDTVFEELRERMNKQLAHLSVERANYSDEQFIWKGADLNRIQAAISNLISQFLTNLAPEQHQWFVNAQRGAPTSRGA